MRGDVQEQERRWEEWRDERGEGKMRGGKRRGQEVRDKAKGKEASGNQMTQMRGENGGCVRGEAKSGRDRKRGEISGKNDSRGGKKRKEETLQEGTGGDRRGEKK